MHIVFKDAGIVWSIGTAGLVGTVSFSQRFDLNQQICHFVNENKNRGSIWLDYLVGTNEPNRTAVSRFDSALRI